MEKRWLYRQVPPQSQIEELSKQINVNPYLSAVLIQRGITSFDEAKAFFRPSLSDLHDPFLMKDMESAVERIMRAIETGERILIYGDYDVDGTTAVSLVYHYLTSIPVACEIYIPDRYTEGYGVSRAGVEWAATRGFTLIVALDCGIKAVEMVSLAAEVGIDFIICDHHMPGTEIPSACAVLDPKQKDCSYPYKELSGCGLGFKLMQAVAGRRGEHEKVFEYLDLVAVSIASDIVPITGENRILAYHGCRKLNQNPLPGLKSLIEIAEVQAALDITGIVFTIGPRINAAGRVDHGSAAVDLLISKSESEAGEKARALNQKNDLRKQVDAEITKEALAMIEANDQVKVTRSTVLYKNDWHKGVIGIVASRCIEKYYRPTVILTESNNKITGSARSVNGFDLYEAILKCSHLLEKFGGHKYAAGLTLEATNLEAFQQKFEEVVAATITSEMLTPAIDVDLELPFSVINSKFINILRQMAPFGPESPKPVFAARNVYACQSLSSFKDRHVKFLAAQQGSDKVFQVVGFDLAEAYQRLANRDECSMVFTIEENTYQGNTTVQLRIKDIKFD